MAAIRDTSAPVLGDVSPATFLETLVANIGSEIVQSDVSLEVSTDLLSSLEARQNSISGVSLDEEAVALIQHQQAYQAAARFMQVLNEISEITLTLGR